MAPAPKVHLDPLALAATAPLERGVKARNARRDPMQRTQALLAVATGQSFAAAARTADFQRGEAVSPLVARFNVRRLAVLETAPERGRQPTYDAPARQRILATVPRCPDRGTDGTATWSLLTLQPTLRPGDPVCAHLGPRRFGGSSPRPTTPPSKPGPGVLPAARSACARAGSSRSMMRPPRGKKTH